MKSGKEIATIKKSSVEIQRKQEHTNKKQSISLFKYLELVWGTLERGRGERKQIKPKD